MRISILTLMLISACVPVLADTQAVVTNDRIVLENQFVRRVLEKDENAWRTVSFARADGTNEVKVESEEFLIRLMDGTELTIENYRSQFDPVTTEFNETKYVSITYEPPGELPPNAPKSLTVEYSVRDEPYLRKTITLMMAKDGAIDRLEVERLKTRISCDRGGRGEPIFIGDSWFVGLEYPGSDTAHRDRLVTVAHFPGLVKKKKDGQWFIKSKTAVAGVGAKGDPLELAFSDYIDTIRCPSRKLLHYNSWYDFRENELNLENFVCTFEGFKKHLLDPYGLRMDVFVPDDGWQERNSIWIPRKNLYPDGFAPLRDALQARGTRLGIWLPLNGFNLSVGWGAEQGYEKSDKGRFYCLVGPKYNAAIREAVKRIITEGNIGYIKHDFNQLRCSAEGHGHLPDDRHGHEANLDAQLEIMAYERQLQPDIFLNVTSYVWLSPCWLMHADTIWMASDDFGYNKMWPQLSPREWAMSYRDAHFYNTYKIRRHLVPVSAMMTCGIIHGPHCKLGGDEETLREWSDYVVMFYGRGVQLQELYITPDMLTPDWWEVLGKATRWAQENQGILENFAMIGGDPRKGEVYGFVHWEEDRGIITLRNPDLPTQTVDVPFDKSVRYRGENNKTFRGRVIYPFVEDLTSQFISGEPAAVTVPGCSVMVLEFQPGEASKAAMMAAGHLPSLVGADAEVTTDETGRRKVSARVAVPDEEMQRCELYLIVRGDEKILNSDKGLPNIEMNAQPVTTRRANGPGWRLQSVDLRPVKGKKVNITATFPSIEQPRSALDVTVSVWFVADRRVKAPPAPQEDLPVPISQKFRRQTVEIMKETKL